MEMGEMGVKNNNNNNNNSRVGGVGVGVVCRPHTTEQATTATTTQSTDFVLQWGNRKRLRCMKIQVKNESTSGDRTRRVRIDRSVVLRSNNNNNNNRDSFSNFRRHFSSPPPPPLIPIPHRISASSRICEGDMKRQGNGVVVTSCSAEEKAQDNKRNNINGNGNGGSASSETALDSKKGGGSSSGSDPIAVWLPKFVISLTNKEKEEDFMAIKGSKLPQRPKKRAKFIQRTLNFVSPGSLLCDLTLERYEVREKKISKKRPRGLKAMGNMESDSE